MGYIIVHIMSHSHTGMVIHFFSHRSSKAEWTVWCHSSDRLWQSALSQLLLGLLGNNVVLVPEWDQVRLKAYIGIFTLPIIHMSSSVHGIVWMVISALDLNISLPSSHLLSDSTSSVVHSCPLLLLWRKTVALTSAMPRMMQA